MAFSMEQVQQRVKDWIVDVDPETEVQVLTPHDDPREGGQIIPIRLGRRGYQWTIGFPDRMFAEAALSEEVQRTLRQVIGRLRYMEARGLPR